jgi:hypothetical protein
MDFACLFQPTGVKSYQQMAPFVEKSGEKWGGLLYIYTSIENPGIS